MNVHSVISDGAYSFRDHYASMYFVLKKSAWRCYYWKSVHERPAYDGGNFNYTSALIMSASVSTVCNDKCIPLNVFLYNEHNIQIRYDVG